MRSPSLLAFCAFLVIAAALLAQDSAQKRETVARSMTEKQKKQQQAKLRKELETPYKKWVDEEVGYIITKDEQDAFRRLQTDDERQQFIEQFWLRRDPTPDTEENEYREEHYRRIAYANGQFASGIPGWKTDRGMIYIKYGPPDAREEHSSGGSYERPVEEGGGSTTTFPFEKWRYRYIEGIGDDINIEFVDTPMTGEYHMTMDPSEKDALTHVRGTDTRLRTGDRPLPASMNQFTRMDQIVKLQMPPAIKYKDLEAAVNSTIKYNLLPMKVRADFIPVTGASVLANITIQFDRKDLQFKQKDGLSAATINIFARITSMTRRPVSTFEDVLQVQSPNEMLQQRSHDIYQKTVPLQPGRYRLNVVAKDVVGGNMTNYEMALDVPRLEDGHLAMSSLILADLIETVPLKNIGTGQFVIGASKVRPRVGDTFKRDETLGIYFQIYNFEPDEKTKKPEGVIQYEIYKAGSRERVLDFSEEVSVIPSAGASQVTIEKFLPLKDLQPGQYTLKVKIVDKKRNQTLTPSANFTVT